MCATTPYTVLKYMIHGTDVRYYTLYGIEIPYMIAGEPVVVVVGGSECDGWSGGSRVRRCAVCWSAWTVAVSEFFGGWRAPPASVWCAEGADGDAGGV